MDWYPWYIRDFRRDTLHLSLAEEGAYRRLIDQYMEQRGPLIDDDASLARLAGVGLDEWLMVAPKVRGFFQPKDGKLHHKRCKQELDAQNERFKRHSERGKKAAFAKYSKINDKRPSSMLTPTTLNTTPITTTSFVSGVGGPARKDMSKLGAAELVALTKRGRQ